MTDLQPEVPAGLMLTAAQQATWDGVTDAIHFHSWGFDFAFGNGITVPQLHKQGCDFVCRYLSNDIGRQKDLSKGEVENYLNGSIGLVLNWETDGQMPDQETGKRHADLALKESRALGIETPECIIFSYDKDPRPAPSAPLPYMRGVASVLGHDRTGFYGGYAAMVSYFNAGIGRIGWQTYAWSDGNWHPKAQIQQWNNNVKVGPAVVDQDRATTADFGQVVKAAKPTSPLVHHTNGVSTIGHIAAGRNMKPWEWLKLQQELNKADADSLIEHARPRIGSKWHSRNP